MAKEELLKKIKSLKCKGLCQESCGPIGISKGERQRIRDYCTRHSIPFFPLHIRNAMIAVVEWKLSNGQVRPEMCPYLQNGKCSVYPVRPMICRCWGTTMEMRCPYGCEPEEGWLTNDEAFSLIPHPD